MVASAAATVPYMILSWEQIAMVLAPGMVKNASVFCAWQGQHWTFMVPQGSVQPVSEHRSHCAFRRLSKGNDSARGEMNCKGILDRLRERGLSCFGL